MGQNSIQFNVSFPSEKDPRKFDCILVLSSPLLLPILYTKPDIFLNGTFRVVPSQFCQQANLKKMIECNIENEQTGYAMAPGVLDVLIVIPANE
eukprot:447763-Ditylum_brightwellii.AAC.1